MGASDLIKTLQIHLARRVPSTYGSWTAPVLVEDNPSLAHDAVGPSTPTLCPVVGRMGFISPVLTPDAAQTHRRSPPPHPQDGIQGAKLAGIRRDCVGAAA